MRVAIVGAGVMAEAMIAGLLADRVPAGQMTASHPRRDRR
jgi:pyrroline-5-carboxylate reductase